MSPLLVTPRSGWPEVALTGGVLLTTQPLQAMSVTGRIHPRRGAC